MRSSQTGFLKLLVTAALLCRCALAAPPAAAGPNPLRKPPKLVVLLVIDQFRQDYLTRFRGEYTGGFDRLLKYGAVFTNANLQHFPTVTAIGHATFLTGATPSLSGIVGNDWYDRESGRTVTSVADPAVEPLGGGKGPGASPRRLLVSTVGDELKMSGKGPSRVIGISFKDRAAILPAGHMADAAYWFDDSTGNFASSSYYFPDLPAWAKEFNSQRQADRYRAMEWKSAGGKLLGTLPAAAGSSPYDSVERSPFGTELLLSFTERAIEVEQLGSRGATDLVSVSLSSTDFVGHTYGPDSPEIHDLNLRSDRALEQFFQYLDQRLGLANILVVFTADHGVSPLAEVQSERRMPGGRMSGPALRESVESALAANYGEGKWVLSASYGSIWLNRALIREKNLKEAEVEERAAEVLAEAPHVYRVYTRRQLLLGQYGDDPVGRRVANGFHAGRSADVIATLEPYWSFEGHEASHGAAFGYDTHVPVIFLGPGIRPGYYDQNIDVNDIAPTLATLLEVETPSGSRGRVLAEMFVQR